MSQDVQLFLAEVRSAQAEIAAFSLAAKSGQDGIAAKRLGVVKAAAADELAKLESAVTAISIGQAQDSAAQRANRQVWRIAGRYRELVDALNRQPFDISEVREADGTLCDFKIKVREVEIPADSATLKGEIDTALNIVKSVMSDRKKRLDSSIYNDTEKDWRAAQTNYMDQLIGIARVGLMTNEPSRVSFARADLNRLKAMFTLSEAGLVKNSYIRRLLGWSALAATCFLILYIIVRTYSAPPWSSDHSWGHMLYETRNFHLMAAGTAIGTWLSFSLRRQELAFEDLAVLEPDRLEPSVRVIYMIGLSSLVGLLFYSGAVVAGIGTVTGQAGLQQHGMWALLFGLLAGVAERSLGYAVQRRSNDFAAAIGGTDTQAKVKV